MAVLTLILLPIVLLALGVPIYVALIAAAGAGLLATGSAPIDAVHIAMFGGLDNFPLLAIPLFIFAGEIMGRGGGDHRFF
jgi:C4-dicarboxylate transporter DctM subunit